MGTLKFYSVGELPEEAIFLDTETTGLYAKTDRVISIGLVWIAGGRIIKREEHFFNPGDVEINPEAMKVHGITPEYLADKPSIKTFLPILLGLLHEQNVGAHNAKFDIDFLDAECKRNRFPLVSDYIIGVADTMLIAKEKYGGKKQTLDMLAAKEKVSTAHRTHHGALLDAEIAADCYLSMSREQMAMDLGATDSADADAGDAIPVQDTFVLKASAEEMAEHEAYLAGLETENKSAPLWMAAEAISTSAIAVAVAEDEIDEEESIAEAMA